MHSEESYVEYWKQEFFSGPRRKVETGIVHLASSIGYTGSYSAPRTEDPLFLVFTHQKQEINGYCYLHSTTPMKTIIDHFNDYLRLDVFRNHKIRKILILNNILYKKLSRKERNGLLKHSIEVWELTDFLKRSAKQFLNQKKWHYQAKQQEYTELLNYNEFIRYLPKKASVLDIGSGSDTTGMVRFLVNSGFEVTTFDRLDMVGDEMKFLYLVKFVKGNFFEDLRCFSPNSFDGITSILAIFVTEKEGMLEFKSLFDSFHYILKPLGYFLITIGAYEYSDDKFIDIAEDSIHNLQNMIKSCGFHILKFSSFMDPDIDKNIRILAQRKS